MNTSIVIPLGTGSRWDNTELRYCLRSVEKHLTGYGDVIIIGEKPAWLRNVIHIPFNEGFAPKSHEKERNIFNKIMAACADDRVTDSFLFMNDDHFLTSNCPANWFPYYRHGRLSEFMTVSEYKQTIKNTMQATRPGDPIYTDIHCPIVYNKELFKRVAEYDWTVKFGYCIKTLYCYHWTMLYSEAVDLKINEAYSADKIRSLIAGRDWFSIGDRAREGGLLKVLQELYPKKSIYE